MNCTNALLDCRVKATAYLVLTYLMVCVIAAIGMGTLTAWAYHSDKQTKEKKDAPKLARSTAD